jgi:hypothetical protein
MKFGSSPLLTVGANRLLHFVMVLALFGRHFVVGFTLVREKEVVPSPAGFDHGAVQLPGRGQRGLVGIRAEAIEQPDQLAPHQSCHLAHPLVSYRSSVVPPSIGFNPISTRWTASLM